MGEDKNEQQIVNQLRLVMIDRMLKEKYNEIEYLAIQTPKDPSIVEINRTDLDWLLSEHEKCEELEGKNAELRKNYTEMENHCIELKNHCDELENQCQAILDSRTYQWGMRLAKIIRFFLAPFRMLRGHRS